MPIKSRALAFAVTLPLLLSGCDAGKVLLDPKEMTRRIEGFGQATRREVVTGEDGTVYELAVEATCESNWAQADRAMWRDLQHTCPDGRRSETLAQSPLADKADQAAIERLHPAGTTFVRTVRCAPRPAFEFDLPAGTDWAAGSRLVEARLTEVVPRAVGRFHVVLPVRYSRYQPKYIALQGTLGMLVATALDDCPAGHRIDGIVLGNFVEPLDGEAARPDSGDLALGLATSCAADEPAP